MKQNSPPKTCFEISVDSSVSNSLGNEIKLFKNDIDIGFALPAYEHSYKKCIEVTQDGDIFKFVNGGTDNVS